MPAVPILCIMNEAIKYIENKCIEKFYIAIHMLQTLSDIYQFR